MSIQAMAWAIEQQEITEPTTRLLLICLCNYADVNGDSIFPSVLRLCRDTGISRRALQYQLRKLEQAGMILKSNQAIVTANIGRADRRPVCYRVIMTGRNQLHPVTTLPRGATKDTTGRNLEHHGAQPIAPDPSEIRHLTKEEDAFKKAMQEAEKVGFRTPEAGESIEAYRMAILRWNMRH